MTTSFLLQARLLCDAVPAPLSVADLDGRLVYQNAAAYSLTGYTADEIRQRFVYEVYLDPSDASYERKALQMHERYYARRIGLSETYEMQAVRKCGMQRQFEIQAAPLVLDGSTISGSIGAIRDITDDKLLQKRFCNLVADKEYLRSQGARLAHDLRNMLFVINGRSESARRKETQSQSLLDKILAASTYAGELVERLQVVCKEQSQRSCDGCDLTEEFSLLADSVRYLANTNVKVSVCEPATPLPTRIDSLEFRQAVMNLTLNAFDAMPAGGKLQLNLSQMELHNRLECTTGTLQPGAYAKLEVTDSGEGVPYHVQSRLFHSSISTKPGGSGAGLWSVCQFVQACGGAMQMISAPSKGATFVLFIPIAE